KILITGICGFAGSVIARTLLEHSGSLSLGGFDNLSRKGSETNIEPLRDLGVDVRIGDVRDRVFLDALPKADWIIDCAANPSVLAGVDGSGSRDLVDQNLYGTVNLLELCKAWGAGFTLLSTSRVYSIAPLASLPLVLSQTRFDINASALPEGMGLKGVGESFSTTPPISLYGSTKLCSERLALEYGSAFGFPAWINRCGVLAGPGQFGKADQGIFSYWIHSWKAGRPLRYIGFGGTGKQVRDCLHPRDIAPILLKQIQGAFPSPIPSASHVVNLSGGVANSMSLLELSAWCRKRLGPSDSESHIENSRSDEIRPYDIPWMVLDSTLAGEIWGWQAATPIFDVLEEIALHAESEPGWLDLVT
ncbi:MAG: NAD-dependent epimerase/dehydratase family protein, partial [Verrucomicrobiota bacterium]